MNPTHVLMPVAMAQDLARHFGSTIEVQFFLALGKLQPYTPGGQTMPADEGPKMPVRNRNVPRSEQDPPAPPTPEAVPEVKVPDAQQDA